MGELGKVKNDWVKDEARTTEKSLNESIVPFVTQAFFTDSSHRFPTHTRFFAVRTKNFPCEIAGDAWTSSPRSLRAISS